ncbi:MlaD family protein [Pseudonocardia halophobica]|uniref:Mammalian cell entry protein n=1 Tax=Pseudonocardia halophobica TaxID=29401 RepID=A0A9W6L0C4_9PSEU|nr:MlaD family protein [Pseudonocardia halophobica]GLL09846.1 mammalian cell entry protein [Pseudonocardia halophobica]
MILTRFIRGQLTALVIATVVGSLILGIVYLRVPDQLGIGNYTVTANFAEAGRLYEGAEVNYRGSSVGRVTAVRLSDTGVEADLRIDSGHDVPTTTRAEVHSLSAVGEQYVDLVPDNLDGPFLASGDTIPVSQTSTPVQIGPVLDQVNALVAKLPADDLNVVVNEAFDAFRGSGGDLQRIIDSGGTLLDAADANYAPTAQLLDDLRPVLGSVDEISPELRSLSADLASVTDQLRESDGDIRGLLTDGRPFAREVNGLLGDVRGTVPTLLANLVTVGGVLDTYEPNLAQALSVYPALATNGQTIVLPNGEDHRANVDLDLALNSPPACTQGFVPADQWRDPADTSVAPPISAFCRLPADDVSGVRGARNTPCAEAPGTRAGTPMDCRGGGTRPVAPNNPPFAPGTALGSLLGDGSRPRTDPLGGRAIGPDGTPYYLRAVGEPTAPEEEMTWQRLLLRPVGR